MWPIALPQTKVAHLLRLALANVVVSANQSETSQDNAVIRCVSAAYPKQIRQRDGNEPLRYQAYRLRIQSEYAKGIETNRLRYQAYRLRIGCVSKSNTPKGWKRIDCGIKRIGCVSAAYPNGIHGGATDLTAVAKLVVQ
jgi:hypothetical protein